MATPVPSKLAQSMFKVAKNWPKDPFRPHLQLPVFLESLSTHPRLTPQAVQAAQALENGTVQKRYPLSDKILKPASVPLHYERLVEGFEKSAQGIARPLWKVFFGIW
ncbi:hypothetical protein V5O48_002616 [Marasmius crinis-equi]|uniref:Uncharacterized protein n=1 Tax=Marasmius crinis-equi TaxID=585013 RepID=A0ABR3FVA5_9AGAR